MDLPKTRTKKETNVGLYTYLIYGAPKAGKSTFCSNFPKALFIATEPGLKFLEVYQVTPTRWEHVQVIVKNLILQKPREFDTVIIDIIDNAWQMCEEYVCKSLGITHVSEADYGKAYHKTRNEFMRVVRGLTQNGYGLVLVSHTDTKDRTVKEGVTERTLAYTDTTLGSTARKAIHGMCDMIFYCFQDTTGARIMRTKGNENLNAGDRSGILPKEMPLDYNNLVKTLNGQITKTKKQTEPKIIKPKTKQETKNDKPKPDSRQQTMDDNLRI